MFSQNIKIRKIQEKSLRILVDIHNFCIENNFNYFLLGGTCIGAVREKGFIEWDDDVDIGIPREEYDKFLDLFKEKFHNIYGIGDIKYDDSWGFDFGKIWDKKTKKKYITLKTPEVGVDVDVYPIDFLPNNKFLRKIIVLIVKINTKLKNTSIRIGFEKGSKYILAKKILHFFIKNVKPKFYIKNSELLLKTFKSKKPIYCLLENVVFEKDIFDDFIVSEFEGFHFRIPVGYDKMLKKLFDNYMIPKKTDDDIYGSHFNYCEVII